MSLVCSFRQDAGSDGNWIVPPSGQTKGHFRVMLWREFTNEKGGIERESVAVSSRPSRKKKVKTMTYGEFHKRYLSPVIDEFLPADGMFLHWGFECRRWT